MKRIILIYSCILFFTSIGEAQVKSMYGEKVEVDVKMKYIFSFEQALKKAKKENKLIFFNCFADWAVPCHGMNKYVFSNQEFADWMDKHFVNFFIDVTTAEGRPLAQKYNIRIQAQYLVLDGNGNVVHRIVGGYQLPQFKEMLAMTLNPKTSLAGMNKRYKAGERSIKFLRSYALVLRYAGEPDLYNKVVDEYFAMIKANDWTKEENWILFSDKVREPLGEMFEYLVAHKDQFVKNNGEIIVNDKISGLYFMPVYGMAQGNTYDGAKLLDIYMSLRKANIPEDQMVYVVYKIAKYRGEKNFEKMMEVFEEKVPDMDKRLAKGLDMSLKDWKEMSVQEKARIVDYLNKRAETMSGSVRKEYEETVKALVNPEGIQFQDMAFEEALKQAKKENKMLFLDCYTSWCGPCKMMSSKVFTQQYIGEFFNERFVNLKIDMEKGEGPDLQKRYDVKAFPTMMLLDGEGKVVYKVLGGCDARGFMEKINRGVASEYNYQTLKQKYDSGDRSAELMPYYFITMIDAGELDNRDSRIRNYLNLLDNNDRFNRSTWVLYDYWVNDFKMPEFEFLCENRRQFAEQMGEEQVNMKIEKVIFPVVIGYLEHDNTKEDIKTVRQLIGKAGLPKQFSLSHLNEIIGLYQKQDFVKIVEYYENTVSEITDRHTKLNLDVILDSLLQKATASVKERAISYVKECTENADPKSAKSYRKLLEDLTVVVK